jgi:hypothetical protein
LLSVGQLGVHLDQVDGDEVACLVHAFADEVTLAESEATADGCAGAGSPHGVEGIDVEGEVDGGVVANVSEGHLDDAANTVTVSKRLVKNKVD